MKHWKLHLWLLLNGLLLAWVLIDAENAKEHSFLFGWCFLALYFFLQTREGIRNIYTQPLKATGVIITFAFVAMWVVYLLYSVNNPTVKLELTPPQFRWAMLAVSALNVGAYFYLLRKHSRPSGTQKSE